MKNQLQSRRQFLRQLTAASALTLLPTMAAQSQGRQVDRIGLQLYTLRKEMTNDFEGTLERVAELGYKEMEFAGYYGRSAGEVRDLLDRLGLSSPASHISLDLIRNDLNKQIDIAGEIGQSYIVIPSVPAAERTLSDFEKHAETLNEVGQKCKEAGLTIVYHNHSFEFEAQGAGTGYEHLLAQTDANTVYFELDLYWAVNANVSPISLFRENPGRFPLVHVKDRSPNGEMADVGKGEIDFSEIFSYAETAGIKHYFVEHDFPEDGMNSVAYSFNTLKNTYF